VCCIYKGMLFFGFESMHPKHTETVLFVLKVNHHMFEVPSSSCWLQLLKCLDKRQLRSTSKYYFIVETSISNLKLAIKHEKTCNNSLRILFKMSDLHLNDGFLVGQFVKNLLYMIRIIHGQSTR